MDAMVARPPYVGLVQFRKRGNLGLFHAEHIGNPVLPLTDVFAISGRMLFHKAWFTYK